MEQVSIDQFMALAQINPVLDVRSPGEFSHAHIPGAYSLPLFSDEERKVVGTLYKQESRQQAIKSGLDYFGLKMRGMVEATEHILEQHKLRQQKSATVGHPANCVLIHCWRGGMRSAGVAWLLNLYGFKVYTLKGGYKAFRNWTLRQFDKPYTINILGGYTGSGKTEVLKDLALKESVIDLEGLANHKGSAFGGLGEAPQPGQEMFENLLALELSKLAEAGPVWMEDESRRIGNLNLPAALWSTMRGAPVYFLDVPFDERLEYITATYGKHKKEELINSIVRIRKRLGGNDTKNAVNFLLEDNCSASFSILLKYYDKFYSQGLAEHERDAKKITVVSCAQVDAKMNGRKLCETKQMQDGIYSGN